MSDYAQWEREDLVSEGFRLQQVLANTKHNNRLRMIRAKESGVWIPADEVARMLAAEESLKQQYRDVCLAQGELRRANASMNVASQEGRQERNALKEARRNSLPAKFMDAARESLTGAQFDAILHRAQDMVAAEVLT